MPDLNIVAAEFAVDRLSSPADAPFQSFHSVSVPVIPVPAKAAHQYAGQYDPAMDLKYGFDSAGYFLVNIGSDCPD